MKAAGQKAENAPDASGARGQISTRPGAGRFALEDLWDQEEADALGASELAPGLRQRHRLAFERAERKDYGPYHSGGRWLAGSIPAIAALDQLDF